MLAVRLPLGRRAHTPYVRCRRACPRRPSPPLPSPQSLQRSTLDGWVIRKRRPGAGPGAARPGLHRKAGTKVGKYRDILDVSTAEDCRTAAGRGRAKTLLLVWCDHMLRGDALVEEVLTSLVLCARPRPRPAACRRGHRSSFPRHLLHPAAPSEFDGPLPTPCPLPLPTPLPPRRMRACRNLSPAGERCWAAAEPGAPQHRPGRRWGVWR